ALRENKHSARDIAEARKQLMNPATKFILDFIHTVDLEPLLDDVRKGLAGLKGDEIVRLEQLEQLE
ncbi:MAG: hypothetical protein WBM35_09280, partial [Candidatus Electrothrix sp.]